MSSLESTLLWVDLRNSEDSHSLKPHFEQHFAVVSSRRTDRPALIDPDMPPRAVCFDYDYPDMEGLGLLKEVRQQYPRLPVIMMTEQHSESLMLWALRVRVWDIIIKPLPEQQAESEVRSLRERIYSQQGWEDTYTSPSPFLKFPEEVRYLTEQRLESRAVHPALSYIQLHMADKITEQQMARLCDMTPAQFSRSFSRAYGTTFQEYVQHTRIEAATRLLHNPHIHLLDVAMAVGFRDQSYFCRVFKKHMGMTPGVYQERHRQEAKASQR